MSKTVTIIICIFLTGCGQTLLRTQEMEVPVQTGSIEGPPNGDLVVVNSSCTEDHFEAFIFTEPEGVFSPEDQIGPSTSVGFRLSDPCEVFLLPKEHGTFADGGPSSERYYTISWFGRGK